MESGLFEKLGIGNGEKAFEIGGIVGAGRAFFEKVAAGLWAGFEGTLLNREAVLFSLARDPSEEILTLGEGLATSVFGEFVLAIATDFSRGVGEEREVIVGVIQKSSGHCLRLPIVSRAPVGSRRRL